MSLAKSQSPQAQDKFTLRVKMLLLTRQQTVTALADALGLARNTVSIAINHPTMLPTVKARIRSHLRLS